MILKGAAKTQIENSALIQPTVVSFKGYFLTFKKKKKIFLEIYIKNLTKKSHFNFLKNFIVKATLSWENIYIYIYIYIYKETHSF